MASPRLSRAVLLRLRITDMTTRPIDRLLAIMAQLRDPQGGCPWDREQDFATIAPYTIEEAYEVADAIERADIAALKDELGDLLLQVVFHARMAEEAGHFAFDDVATAISDKMVRRHPHVFGDAEIASVAAQNEAWEAHKAAERQAAGGAESVLDGVALALPALIARRQDLAPRRAHRLRLAGCARGHAEDRGGNRRTRSRDGRDAPQAAIEEELGDLLFAVANLARKLEVEPETALRRATSKFERRFRASRDAGPRARHRPRSRCLEDLWDEVKRRGKGTDGEAMRRRRRR